jgi:hypothetical protein
MLAGHSDPNARWCPFENRDGSDIACRSSDGMTPLLMAAILDLTDITYLLLDAHADPRAASFGTTPLAFAHSAAEFLLLQSAMFPASPARNAATLEFLRKSADTPNSKWPWDQTALAHALGGCRENLLLNHGADPTLRDWRGRTAADYRGNLRTR